MSPLMNWMPRVQFFQVETIMRISIGVIIAIILVFFWYKKDHPEAFNASAPASPPAATGTNL